MPNQYVNKIVINGQTKIDLTADTVDASSLLSGKTAHDRSGAVITGTMPTIAQATADATASASEILSTKTAYVAGAKVTGSMPNIGEQVIEIDDVDDEITITQGYHDGSGKAKIAAADKAKIISENIRDGVTILGVEGSMSGSEDVHAQSKNATPTFSSQTISPDTPTYNYLTSVVIAPIPVTYVDNQQGGQTCTVG